jgi:multiple sugar transport system permease protein
VAARPRPRRRPAARGRALTPYLFVLPAAVFLLALVVYPMLYNIQLSFRDVTAGTLLSGAAQWAGFDNYREILADPTFGTAVLNSIVFTFTSIVFQAGVGMALALFYQREFPGSRTMGSLYLIAWAVPVVVSGAVFRWLLDGRFGVINWALRSAGLSSGATPWLAEPDKALAAVIFVNVWLGVPFNMVLLLAGLRGIPKELHDAASVDGAGAWRRFRHITIPLLRPAFFAVLMLGLIYTFRVFDLIWTMTRGGPVDATQVLPTYAFELVFQQFRFGQGAAVMNVLFVVLFVLSLGYLRTLRREEAPA